MHDRYRGDLRRLRHQAHRDAAAERRLLKDCKGIGDVGADIFAREVQGQWSELGPFFGERALDAARRLDLPTDPKRLEQACRQSDLPRLAASLMRVSLAGHGAIERLRNGA